MAKRDKKAELESEVNGALPAAVARALEDKKSAVDAGTLLSDLIEVWGGTRQLAVDIHAEFQRASKGGMSRQRILEMFQRLIMYASDRDATKVVRPAELSQADQQTPLRLRRPDRLRE
jgi:hypothetical protein